MTSLRPTTSIAALLSLAASAASTGCGQPDNPTADKPYRAPVVVLTGVESDQGRAKFSLEERTFRYLDDLDGLNGSFINLRRGGELLIKEVNGSIVEADKFTGSKSPDLRYTVKNGAVVPRDYSTLAMLSGYYQFEEVLAGLEERTGETPEAVLAGFPDGKLTVFFEPEIKLETDEAGASVSIKLNAAYVPKEKQFILFQRSPVEDVPLSMNLQVISHEFGHGLFEHSFFNGGQDPESRWSKEYTLSGINEGWADLVSFQYTQTSDVLRGSIDIEDIADERNFLASSFTYNDLNPLTTNAVKDDDSGREICSGRFYCVGTLFARTMRQAQADLATTVTAKEFMAGMIAAMKKTGDTLNAQPATILPAEEGLDRYEDLDEDDDPFEIDEKYYEYDGKIAGAFLNSFIQNLPTAWRPTVCQKTIANFGSVGFPAAARAVCD